MNSKMLQNFKERRLIERVRVRDKYEFLGFLSSGTYGRVYKVKLKQKDKRFVNV